LWKNRSPKEVALLEAGCRPKIKEKYIMDLMEATAVLAERRTYILKHPIGT